ncbi:MAG TPA: hypothetical protein VK470_11375 [Bacteroidota bacterium]|nr:hypothetical protein [Bacteroidota bacterium]
MAEPEKRRDIWEKVALVFQAGGGIITAVTVAVIGLIGSNYLKERELADTQSRERMQAAESNVRVYTELMSKREEAESSLRKDMFVSIIQSFLSPRSGSLDEKVLNLELLAYNFHESLNLKPLFIYLERQIKRSGGPEKTELEERLVSVAREITHKQMLVLEGAGAKADRIVDLTELKKTPGGIVLDEVTLKFDDHPRHFSIVALQADMKTHELKVRLEVRSVVDSTQTAEMNAVEFWVGPFDFPMIDNTRLSNDQRCAIVLNAFDTESADITLVFFPGAYASLKEKPYYQEVVANLMKTNEQMRARLEKK